MKEYIIRYKKLRHKLLEKHKCKNFNEKGITLIALIVTIIVLLILSAVVLIMLAGKNSILRRAETANEEYEIGAEKEQVDIAQISLKNETDVKEETWEKLIANTKATKITETDYIIKFNNSGRLYWVKADKESSYMGKDQENEFREIEQDGTKEKPYVINTIEDLVDFSNNVRTRNII